MEYQQTGFVEVEKVRGKSTVTRCFSKYPLKFIVPTKVGPSSTDAVWIYSISYGGGIVSGDRVSCGINVGEGGTVVLTTQASTKVYKSVGAKCSEQYLEARIGKNALLVVIPDPVTCFATARYCQKQVFRSFSDSNLVLVDWLTSGRYESGEQWQFDSYRSTNHIFIDGDQPIFLDSTLLEQGSITTSIAEGMHFYHVIAMVVFMGTKLEHVKDLVQEHVKKLMSQQFYAPKSAISGPLKKIKFMQSPPKLALIASCSSFGPKGIGMVVRIAADTTEAECETGHVVFICNRRRLEFNPPCLSQGINPSSDVFQRIKMKYLEDDEGIKKYFAAFHLHGALPLAVIIDDFGDFFQERNCQEKFGNARGRDLAMVRVLALCQDAINHANEKFPTQRPMTLLISDTHHGDLPRSLFIYKRWVSNIFTVKGDGSGSYLLKSSSSACASRKMAKYSTSLQYLVLEDLRED
ncbi:hypothetical protein H6P81_019137 [Aristolochia fimbriata]|uniref:Urease accessory protein D n=1 Tax=Aristolochia fimbriata TaxID=158543 RepID=A0AAV7DUJ8_ARIFI|nr:hypothetical protein H6P81_019137 [Aristolochia fimbriata]